MCICKKKYLCLLKTEMTHTKILYVVVTGYFFFLISIQKMKIMASSPITSWEIDGETVETLSDFIFWGFRISKNGDCSHEIKRCLLLGRKAMTNLGSIKKQRHYFPNKGLYRQGYGFSSGHLWM